MINKKVAITNQTGAMFWRFIVPIFFAAQPVRCFKIFFGNLAATKELSINFMVFLGSFTKITASGIRMLKPLGKMFTCFIPIPGYTIMMGHAPYQPSPCRFDWFDATFLFFSVAMSGKALTFRQVATQFVLQAFYTSIYFVVVQMMHLPKLKPSITHYLRGKTQSSFTTERFFFRSVCLFATFQKYPKHRWNNDHQNIPACQKKTTLKLEGRILNFQSQQTRS